MDNQLHLNQEDLSDITADIGMIYVNKHKFLLPTMINHIQDKLENTSIKVICFKLNDLDIETKKVSGFLIFSEGMKDFVINIPPIIFNMGYFTLTKNLQKLKKLRLNKDITLINPHNRFNQFMVFDMLSALYNDSSILMPYSQFNKMNLHKYLKKYKRVYLVPEKSATKKKNLIINLITDDYTINLNSIKVYSNKEDIFSDLMKITDKKKYMQFGCLDDIILFKTTVYMQKTNYDTWTVTNIDMENPTNVTPIDNLKLESFLICQFLEHYLYDIGCFTLEFNVSSSGEYRLIYIGGWDDDAFLLMESFWPYFDNAIDYSITIYKKGVKNEE